MDSPLLFNCAKKKLIRKWREQKAELNDDLPIQLDRTNILINFLEFSDDVGDPTRDIRTAEKEKYILYKKQREE